MKRTGTMLMFIILVSLGAGGCAVQGGVGAGSPSARSQGINQYTYDVAVEVYRTGDYDRSAKLFNEIAADGSGPILVRKAQYGAACAALAAAKDQKEFEAALEKFEKWASDSSRQAQGEDPSLLMPVLRRARELQQERIASASENQKIRKSLAALQDQIQQKERVIDSLEDRLQAEQVWYEEANSRRLTRLKQRINFLEAMQPERLMSENAMLRERIRTLADDSKHNERELVLLERIQQLEALRPEELMEENTRLQERIEAYKAMDPSSLARENKDLQEKIQRLASLEQENERMEAELQEFEKLNPGKTAQENAELQERISRLEANAESRLQEMENELERFRAMNPEKLESEVDRLQTRIRELESLNPEQLARENALLQEKVASLEADRPEDMRAENERLKERMERIRSQKPADLVEENERLLRQINALEDLYREMQVRKREYSN
ncbi:MAG: hypothetical protein ACOC0U_03775 [Desulfovibrionales bacterium]